MPGASSRPAASPSLGFSAGSSGEGLSPFAVKQQVPEDGLADREEPTSSRQAGGLEFPLEQRWQQHKRHPLHLSHQEVADVTELCLGVIEDYEEEKAAVASAISSKRRLDDSEAPEEGLEDGLGDRQHKRSAVNSPGDKNARRRTEEESLFVDYAALRPAYFQELRVASAEAASDMRATVDSTLSEADVAIYAKRTVAALLLASPWPLRLEDVRKRWQATPVHARRRNLTVLVLHCTAKILASCLGLHMISFLVRGSKYIALRQGGRFKPHLQLIRSRREEEVRGFLLFLSAQFLSARAELPLETLKAHLRLVGRSDLLRDFDEASLLKALHVREQPLKLDSLEAFLSYCESLKYITIVRRSLGTDLDLGASIFILPTGRLLQELQTDAFRAECREHFGVEPPDTPLHPPEAEPSDSRPSQSGAPT